MVQRLHDLYFLLATAGLGIGCAKLPDDSESTTLLEDDASADSEDSDESGSEDETGTDGGETSTETSGSDSEEVCAAWALKWDECEYTRRYTAEENCLYYFDLNLMAYGAECGDAYLNHMACLSAVDCPIEDDQFECNAEMMLREELCM